MEGKGGLSFYFLHGRPDLEGTDGGSQQYGKEGQKSQKGGLASASSHVDKPHQKVQATLVSVSDKRKLE
jgi:hypothetical protein